MTSPLVHHLPNWHVAGMITRPTDSDWWLWWNSDCGMQLWPVVWCRRIITWLPLKVPTLTLNLDNWGGSSTSFFRGWLLSVLIIFVSTLHSVLLMLQHNVPQQRTSLLSVDFWLLWSSAAIEWRDPHRGFISSCFCTEAKHHWQLDYSVCCIGRLKVWLLRKCRFGSFPFIAMDLCSFRLTLQSQPFLAFTLTLVELPRPESLE